MALATDPTAPTDPTATAGLAKKAPALPLATPAPTASPTLSGTNPQATTQPVGPVTPAGPATTSDPMAFAPAAGGLNGLPSTPPPGAPAVPTQTAAAAPVTRSQFPDDAAYNDYMQYQQHVGLQNQQAGNLSAQYGFTPTNGDEWVQRYQGPDASRHATSPGNPVANDAFLTNYDPNNPNQLGKSAGLDAAWATDKGAYDKNWDAFTHGQAFTNPTNAVNNSPAYLQQKADAWNQIVPPSALQPNGGGTPPIPADPGALNGLPSRSLKPGPANDVNPSGQLPLGAPPLSATTNAPQAPSSGGTLNGMPVATGGQPTLKPTDPNNPLTAQTISAGPTADRFATAQDQWDQWHKATDPAYQADLRSQDAHDFGYGRGVSGMHRNSIGDIATQRVTANDTEKRTFLDQALNGSIDDAYKNVGIAQQQQGFQADQQKTGFNQNVTVQQLADLENNQAFQQAYQKALLGYSGDPSQLYMELAAIYGAQGTAASTAATNYATAQGNKANSATGLNGLPA